MPVAARKTATPTRDPGALLASVPIETSPDLWQTSFDLCEALNALIAGAFALYPKTKNFQWHVSGPHFRDYYLLFEEQATQILPMTDAIAERVRKNGARTLRSIGHIARMQRLHDNDHELVAPQQMLGELTVDNASVARSLEEAHELCEQQRDMATASLIEGWIDEAQNHVWFLREANGASGEFVVVVDCICGLWRLRAYPLLAENSTLAKVALPHPFFSTRNSVHGRDRQSTPVASAATPAAPGCAGWRPGHRSSDRTGISMPSFARLSIGQSMYLRTMRRLLADYFSRSVPSTSGHRFSNSPSC